MRKIAFLVLLTAVFGACQAPEPDVPVDTGEITENEVIGGQVTVDFFDQAEEWPTERIVAANRDYYLASKPDYMDYQTDEEYLDSLSKNGLLLFWEVGTFESGDYEGQSLVTVRQACDGPCPSSLFRYAVQESEGSENSTWTFLADYSDSLSDSMTGAPSTATEEEIRISSLEVPDVLNTYENDGAYLTDERGELNPHFYGEADGNLYSIENFDNTFEEISIPEDDSFTTYLVQKDSACIYGVTPDGVLVRYGIVPNIFGVEPTEKGTGPVTPVTTKELTLEKSDGESVQNDYMLYAGGCGFAGSCLISEEATAAEESQLQEVGTLDGRAVYMFKSLDEDDEPDYSTLTGRVQSAYNSYKMTAQYKDPPESPVSLEEYLASYSLVLIKLDNGNYAMAYDSDYAPSVECGKPVIYLYPTVAQEVSVKVNNIDFSVTIPEHGSNGWTVWANPNGTLTNLADGLNYPYLFWEGQSSATVTMGEGWTLAKKDIATKLPKALTGMGLSNKETADFMEFWLPRLQAVKAPYVLFNFEGTAAMNEVAPLTIAPAPDTLLRVFMYYQAASAPSGFMPKYTAPARNGFTVIEWGGSLY